MGRFFNSLGKYWRIGVVLAALLALTVWLRSGPDELTKYKAGLRARGERLSMKEVAPTFTPEAAAALQVLTGAVGRLQTIKIHPSVLDPMKELTRGFAAVAWKQDSLQMGGGSTRSWDELAIEMKQHAQELQEIRGMLRNPPAGPSCDISDLSGLSGSSLIAKRKALFWLLGAVLDALHGRRLDEALTNLNAMTSLSKLNQEEPMLVNQMIRIAIAGVAVSATWEALQAPELDDARLAALSKAWEAVSFLPQLEKTMEMERAAGLAVFEYSRTNRNGPEDLLGWNIGGIDSTNSLAQAFNAKIYLPVWQKTWSRRDELCFFEETSLVRQAIRTANATHAFVQVSPILQTIWRKQQARKQQWNQFRFPLCNALVPNWQKALPRVMRQESFRQMTIGALAIKRHQLKHGRLPASLDELVPEFLSSIPQDYMTGQPLLYKPNPDGSFVLYSAGENAQDEHGLGDDLVWPGPGLPPKTQ